MSGDCLSSDPEALSLYLEYVIANLRRRANHGAALPHCGPQESELEQLLLRILAEGYGLRILHPPLARMLDAIAAHGGQKFLQQVAVSDNQQDVRLATSLAPVRRGLDSLVTGYPGQIMTEAQAELKKLGLLSKS
jgi:hypothetical protein